MTTRKPKLIKRHRSAATGEFVTKGKADKSPLDTLAETVAPRTIKGSPSETLTMIKPFPNITVAFNVWDRDLKNMLRQMAQEGVIIGLCCQPDGRYTIAVERV